MNFLQRRDDEELQPEPGEEFQRVARRDVRATPESLVDDREPEVPRLLRTPLKPELVGERRGQDGVGELLLLAARLAVGVAVVLPLVIGFGVTREPRIGLLECRCDFVVDFVVAGWVEAP